MASAVPRDGTHNIAGSQEGGRAGFFPFQLVMVSPVLVPVWIAGLRAPRRDAIMQHERDVRARRNDDLRGRPDGVHRGRRRARRA